MSEHVLDQRGQGATQLQSAIPTPYGVWGDSSTGSGVIGSSDNVAGTVGISHHGVGVAGTGETNVGVFGTSLGGLYSYGVWGDGFNAGVVAFNRGNDNAAYLASDCCAAWFTGQVHVAGLLTKSGGGFRIDHPLDPANRQLSHSFVESLDMKNLYDGIIELDINGEAVIELPEWFAALNGEFRYQLTCIGGYASVYIAEEIQGNRFKIAGGRPELKVSWQVTGIRQDAWAIAHRVPVEEDKPVAERGRYFHPEVHGATPDMSIERVSHPQHEQQRRHPRPSEK